MLNLKTIEYLIEGVSPLIHHNQRLCNPLDPIVKQMKEITAKRKKTDEDHMRLARLEFEGGLYIDESGPYIPSEWVESMIRDGAKTFKQGKDSVASLLCTESGFQMIYKGPRTVDALFAVAAHVSTRSVKVTTSRVMRTRPIFPAWSCKFRVSINADVMSAKDVERAIDNAGVIVGMGDYRPKFGRFIVKSAKEI